jgi:hypothetical protein
LPNFQYVAQQRTTDVGNFSELLWPTLRLFSFADPVSKSIWRKIMMGSQLGICNTLQAPSKTTSISAPNGRANTLITSSAA